MAGYLSGDVRKVTTHRLTEMKQRGEKILCLPHTTTQWRRLLTEPELMLSLWETLHQT